MEQIGAGRNRRRNGGCVWSRVRHRIMVLVGMIPTGIRLMDTPVIFKWNGDLHDFAGKRDRN